MKKGHYLFTSESVSEGHPDKVADQISDAILDECLAQDSNSHVACETLVTTGLVTIAGEITTKAQIDYQKIVRNTIKKIGYTDPAIGFDYESCGIIVAMDKQSPDINRGVEKAHQGAGDQGMMFGYACTETDTYMPAPIYYAHKLIERLQELRHANAVDWLRPDAKSQVTFEYDENNEIVRLDTIVISTQHAPTVSQKEIHDFVVTEVINKVMPEEFTKSKYKLYVNPTGNFVIGGPHGDCGLTGRKIIVDTYGGMGRHGGGAFSGKDPSKVDRSGAYAARYVAKNIVAARIATRCEVQLAYAIGVEQPVSVYVNTFGTGVIDDSKIAEIVQKVFDLTPSGIINTLKLKTPGYIKTASLGHFGRTDKKFTWEKTDKASTLAKMVKHDIGRF